MAQTPVPPGAGPPQPADYQLAVYLAGLQGQRPAFPMSVAAMEALARERLTPEAYAYVAGGAGAEETVRANREAFSRWRIVPRMLCGIERRRLGVSLFGIDLPAPVMLAPVGVQSIVHPEAELASARAAAALGIPVVLSTAASRTLEQVAAAMGDAPRWFQLYWPKDRELARSFVGRAERAGYRAIVLTLDTFILGWRERDLQQAYLPFLQGEGVANYFSDPVFRGALVAPPEKDPLAAVQLWASLFTDPTLTWNDLAFLRGLTRLPILLKGILHPEDARAALEAGMDGLIVSNHGGRQVDGAIAALDALPGVVKAVGGRVPVLFDSGIRSGADAFKALALGARAVLLGRPYIWGLAVGGEAGVRHVLLNFLADLDLTFALAGCPDLARLDASALG